MLDTYQLRDVFSRGMPTITYVQREHLGLEQELKRAVSKGYVIIAVTGPSKCGKTVLRRRVIPQSEVVHVEGGQVGAEDDFWDAIRIHLEVPNSESKTASKQTGGSAGIEASIGPSFAKIGTRLAETDGSSRTDTRTFNGPQKGKLLDLLIAKGEVW